MNDPIFTDTELKAAGMYVKPKIKSEDEIRVEGRNMDDIVTMAYTEGVLDTMYQILYTMDQLDVYMPDETTDGTMEVITKDLLKLRKRVISLSGHIMNMRKRKMMQEVTE